MSNAGESGRHRAAPPPEARRSPGRRRPLTRADGVWAVCVVAVVAMTLMWASTFVLPEKKSAEAAGGAACVPAEIVVAAHPAIAPSVRDLLAQLRCGTAEVVPAESADVAAQVAAGKGQPDLWIPDSSLWLERTSGAPSAPEELVESIASTPVVLVANGGGAPRTWAQALRDDRLLLGDPVRETPTAAALMVTSTTTRREMATLARRASERESEAPAPTARLDQVRARGGALTVATEQLWLARAPDLVASIPAEGTIVMNFPLIHTATTSRREKVLQTVLEARQLLSAPSAADRFTHAGFRGTDLESLEDGAGPVSEFRPSRERAAEMLRQWVTMAIPLHAIVAIDVSASMATATGGRSRIDLAGAAVRAALNRLPLDAEVGLWAFSSSDDGRLGADFREILPVRRLDQELVNTPHWQRHADELGELPALVGGGTALHATTLAAYREAQRFYDPESLNVVYLISDGSDDGDESMTLDDLRAEIQRLADPERPIRVVTIAISTDAGPLAAISETTGAPSYVAAEPRSVREVFLEAVATRPIA